eukprot:TRINITY_DN3619_c0_g1_i2.p1 TRINITY_DN3619_c0_g1~~TRINITY_DN3619_c0_g1_i2.p1  ORF type:complete len:519 (-),score=85.21 TRINITY_DN3619_c0_g1_i2:219-1775(-)
MIEIIHVILFAVFGIYLIEVIILLVSSNSVVKTWKKYEKEVTKDPHGIISEYLDLRRSAQSGNIGIFDSSYDNAKEKVMYLSLRDHFINPPNPAHKLPSNFNFANYLSIRLGHTLSHIVHIHPTTWGFLAFLFACFFGISNLDDRIQLGILLLFIWLLLAITIAISLKLKNVTYLLTPYVGDAVQGHSLNTDDEETPLVKNSGPKYLSMPLKEKTCIEHIFTKHHVGNRHQRLFFMESKGPSLILHVTRTILLVLAIFLAGFVVRYIGLIENHEDIPELWLKIVLYVLFFIPVIPIMLQCIFILKEHVICSNVEMMKHKDTIEKVKRKAATKRALKLLRLLNSMRSFVRRENLRKGVNTPRDSQERIKLPPEEIARIREIFNLFDKDHSGAIDREEFRHFMNAIGDPVTETEADSIISQIDTDGNGVIDLEEFIYFMEDNANDADVDCEQTIMDLFYLFDKDHSGTITTPEFKQMMMNINDGTLSESDIDKIIKDLDTDGNGEIDLEEFTEMVKSNID